MKGWQKGTAQHTGFGRTGGLSGLAFTEQLKLTTYLLGVQEAATREGQMTSHTWPTLKADTKGTQM